LQASVGGGTDKSSDSCGAGLPYLWVSRDGAPNQDDVFRGVTPHGRAAYC